MKSAETQKRRLTLRNRRIYLIGAVFSILYLIVGGKAFYLQVVLDNELSARALSEYREQMEGRGKRGTIYDVKYREMALSTNVVAVGVHPGKIPKKKQFALQAAIDLNTEQQDIFRNISQKRPFVWLDRQASPLEAEALKAGGFPGLEFFPGYCRVYPGKTLGAQVLGFSGIDGNGLEGLEFYYDDYLKGNLRQWTIIKDALGRIFDRKDASILDYQGKNLILTLDSTIQYITEKALKKAVEENNAKSGTAVVIVPQTGAVRAMAHYPTFNPNSYSVFPKETWRNRVITDAFEPGSTLKVFVAAAALESGLVREDSVFNCENGSYRIGPNTIHDTHPYGNLTLGEIIKYSSNIGAVKVSEVIGPKRLYHMLRKFGFGEKTGIDCPGETPGLMRPYQEWKRIDNAAIAFGQGISVSAIQLVSAVAAIANHGMLMQPRLVKAVTDKNGEIIKSFPPREVRQAVSPETAAALSRMMHSVTREGGTGTLAAPAGYEVCGKTGTAQEINPDGTYRNCEYNGVFVGFSPANDPQLAVLVVIDSPRKSHYGGLTAAPAFREIITESFNYMNLAPRREDSLMTCRKGTS